MTTQEAIDEIVAKKNAEYKKSFMMSLEGAMNQIAQLQQQIKTAQSGLQFQRKYISELKMIEVTAADLT